MSHLISAGRGLYSQNRGVIVVNTDETCVIHGRAWPGIPTILEKGSDRIITEPSNWLRFLVVNRRRSVGTARESAAVLSQWLNRLGARNLLRVAADGSLQFYVDARSITDDDFLMEWREEMDDAGIVAQRNNVKTSCIFNFLLWCQDRGYVSGLLGNDGKCPISVNETTTQSKHGQHRIVRRSWTGPLRITRRPYRHTPTDQEAEAIHVAASDDRHATRNCLMASWAEEVGLRRAEIRGILVADIPSIEVIEKLAAQGGVYRLRVRNAKGGNERSVPVPWHLLRMTREYLDIERAVLVSRRAPSPRAEPVEVFLSDRGTPLNQGAISNLFNRLFFDAGVMNASLHRFRAAFLKRVVESFMGNVDEQGLPIGEVTILLQAAEYAGHSNLESLRPYINELKKVRSEHSGAADLAKLRREKRLLQREIAALESRRQELRKRE
jgi:integrase